MPTDTSIRTPAYDYILGGVQRFKDRGQTPAPRKAIIEASVEDFIRGDQGLDLGDEPFPRVVSTITDLMDGGYHDPLTNSTHPYLEAFLEWGIGAGKDYAASVYLLCNAARVLQSMIAGTFWFRHGLATNSRIELAHFAPDEASATEVLHSELVSKADGAPWFRKFAPIDDKMRTRIRFRRTGRKGDYWPLEIVPRGCSMSKRLGRNLYRATIDEANFWANTTGVTGDDALNLYYAISRRLRSRFGDAGQLLMFSSSNYDGDLSSRKEKEAIDPTRRIFYSKAASWEVKPPTRYNSAGLTFDYEEKDNRGNVVRVWKGIPIDLKGDFEGDPHLALRDYAGVRYGDVQTLDPDAEWLFKEPPAPEGRGPIPTFGSPFLMPYGMDRAYLPLEDTDYFLHFDLATSGDPRADGLGISLVHPELLMEDELFPSTAFANEPYSNVVMVIDFAERVMPKDVGGERCIEDTRQFVYDLLALGFPLACVSYDGFQSTDSRQILAQHGVTTRLISVDKTLAPYQTLKRLLHAGRVIYGPSVWQPEYAGLKLKGAKKVDHAPGKSKDGSDAAAGAVYSCWMTTVALMAGRDPDGGDAERITRMKQRRSKQDADRQERHGRREEDRARRAGRRTDRKDRE
jgi:hypothetical protein